MATQVINCNKMFTSVIEGERVRERSLTLSYAGDVGDGRGALKKTQTMQFRTKLFCISSDLLSMFLEFNKSSG